MMAEEAKNSGKPDGEAGIGWLTGIAFLSLLAAVSWALYDFRLTAPGGTPIVGNLCALSLICLLFQFAVGFPVEKAISDSVLKSAKPAGPGTINTEPLPSRPSNPGNFDFESIRRQAQTGFQTSMAESEKGFNAAMAMMITVDTRFWFFLELLALSVPTGLRIRELVVLKQPASVPFQPRPLSPPARGLDSLINRR